MDLKSGYPFWAIRNGLMHAHPRLEANLDCGVAVIGAGITGALIADALAAAGHEVAVLEQRDVAWGSTAASTALLQYEIDTPMVELAERYGAADAVAAYRACADAIARLRERCDGLGDVGFRTADSVYYASRRRDVLDLQRERAMRREHGLPAQWMPRTELAAQYGLDAEGALRSDIAASVDPYRMAHGLLARVARKGAVYDRTRVLRIDAGTRRVTLELEGGGRVRAGHVVMATGYAAQQWLRQRVASNRSSYAFVTDPLHADVLGALSRTLVWESARPYLYLRATDDGRLLVGGEDDAIDLPARRDRRVERKAARLARKVRARFAHLDLQPAFAWGGTFAETADGLPFVGAHAEYGPRVHFAMAYGGNGITYSQIASEILVARLARQRHPLQALFSFERLSR